MGIILHHGSKNIIEKPIYGYGKKYNDYGLAFYCTESIDMANEWSVDFKQDGYRNTYELDCSGLKILDLLDPSYCILHWLTILVTNRQFDIHSDFAKEAKDYLTENYLIDVNDYDIIKGYRADDSYFSFAQDFLNNTISVDTLKRAMMLGRLGEQIAIKSKKAFGRIQYIDATYISADQWYASKMERDNKARASYFAMRTEKRKKGALYMMQIVDEEVKADDSRL